MTRFVRRFLELRQFRGHQFRGHNTYSADFVHQLGQSLNPISYNAASGIQSAVRTGDAYAWTGPSTQNLSYVSNGLNRYTTVASLTPAYDARGNLTSDGTNGFSWSSENLLVSGPNSSALTYDPMMRLQQINSGSSTTRFAYDGLARIAELDGSNAIQRRYVHGPGMDEPIVWYEGAGTADRRFLSSDERGSIISVTDSSGSIVGINKYDEYGIPQLNAAARTSIWASSSTPGRPGCRRLGSIITRRGYIRRPGGGSCRRIRLDIGAD